MGEIGAGMDLWQLFNEYFIKPMDERTGYNPVNTAVYAAVALLAAYLIYRMLKWLKIKVDEGFISAIATFVLFGSTLRVVVDANILPYTYVTTTPGIYFLISFITIAAVLILHRFSMLRRLWQLGALLWLASLAPLIPIFRNFDFLALILLLALAGAALGNAVFTHLKVRCRWQYLLVVFSHALDGAATFVSIDIFSKAAGAGYFEQHVVTNVIASAFGGFWAFYAIKILFAIAAVWLLDRDSGLKDGERNYVILLVIIFGLAPGVRDVLRLLCGV